MREIIHSKINSSRKKEFQIETKIVREDNNLFVVKKPLYSTSHIEHIVISSKLLRDIYGGIVIVPKINKNEIIYDYQEGKTLEDIFLNGEYLEALSIYKNLVNVKENLVEFELTDEFVKVFGNIEIGKVKSQKLANIDMILSNIIVSSDNKLSLIDCEWVFNFPIPVDFIYYRTLKELFSNQIQGFSFDDAAKYLEIELDLSILEKMDQSFNNYVFSNEEDNVFKAKENYVFDAIENSQKEIDRLNTRIEELGSWGKELDDTISSLNKEITNKNEEIEERNNHISKLDEEINKNRIIIDDLNDDLEERNNHIKILDDQINQNRSVIEKLSDDLEKRDSHINKLDEEINDNRVTINTLNRDLEDKDNQIKELNNEKSALCLELSQKENDIASLKDTIAKKDSEITIIKSTITQKDVDILSLKESLYQSDAELSHIKNSTSYRFLLKYFKVRDFFFPKNSRRRAFMKLFVKMIRHPIWFIKHLTPSNIKKFFKYSKSEGMDRTLERIEIYKENTTPMIYSDNLVLENMNPRENYEELVFNKETKPLVSIIIPVYNQFSYTYGCLRSIFNNTKNIKYEIIIGDDCSTDQTKDIKKIVKNITVVRNKKNLRFLLNCNNASKFAKGKYILFLNNDTNVQPDWLDSLIETIESKDSIGMVGSKLVYPNGLLQEAGGILWKDGSAWNYGNKSDSENSEFNYRKPVDYISGAAIMIKAKLWKRIGGFDTRFVPAYCEDSDLAFEVRKHGYEVIYDPFSVVVHYEGVSNGTDITQGVKKYQVDNSIKFYEKWKTVLESHYPNAENVFSARDRSNHKKTILMIDHYVPQYDKDAGSRTVFNYLRLFAKMGYNVKFIGENFYRHEPYTKELQKLGIEVLYGPYYANHWKEWLKQCGNSIDLVFFNRPHITIKFIDDVKKLCPRAKYIYYGHDLHYVRIKREYELKKEESLLRESEHWKEIEFSIYKKVDLVFYPSNVETAILKKEGINSEVLQPYLFENTSYIPYDFEKRKDILFVGGFRHSPNYDGIMWFINNVFPDIIKIHKDIKLYVAGSYPPKELLDSQNENIIVTGFVSDEGLDRLYKSVRLVVVPLRYGAGIKGKVIEAMANNVPVVTTTCGAEGIVGDALIIDNTLLSINELYNNKEKLQELSKKECDYIKFAYSLEAAEKKMKEYIGEGEK